MDEKLARELILLVRGVSQILSLERLYSEEHPAVVQKIKEVYAQIAPFLEANRSLILAETETALMVNGQPIEASEGLVRRFAESFKALELGMVELEHGLSREEFTAFVSLLSHTNKVLGIEEVKKFLKERSCVHIIPRFATYKLVGEHEKITKEGQFLDISKLPKEEVTRFTEGLKSGKIVSADLAHSPEVLAQVVTGLSSGVDSPDALSKILWLIGDFLINEIGTVKQEEMNRKVLERLKSQLLAKWQDKQDKEKWQEESEKTFSKITAALELKGLILLYKKHKKEVEITAGKVKSILDEIPAESQLLQKAKSELREIGEPEIDKGMFQ